MMRLTGVELTESPDGQVRDTIALMGMMAVQDIQDPWIQSLARQLWSKSAGIRKRYIQLAWEYVHNRVTFTQDERIKRGLPLPLDLSSRVVEILTRPKDLVRANQPIGDCDDFTMLLATLLLAKGITVRFVTVAAEPGDDTFSHVYLVAYLDGQRIPLDASHGKVPGWEYQRGSRYQEWELPKEGMGMLVNVIDQVPVELSGVVDGDTGSGATGGSGSGWISVINNAINSASTILGAHFGQPQQPGTVITGPGGTRIATTGTGVPIGYGYGADGGVSQTSMILLAAGVGLMMIFAMKGKGN